MNKVPVFDKGRQPVTAVCSEGYWIKSQIKISLTSIYTLLLYTPQREQSMKEMF